MADVKQEIQMDEQVIEKSDLVDQHGVLHVADIIHIHATPEQEARVLRKIDRVYKKSFPLVLQKVNSNICNSILPLMGFCYMLQYTDKISLGFSTQLGLMADLVCIKLSFRPSLGFMMKITNLYLH